MWIRNARPEAEIFSPLFLQYASIQSAILSAIAHPGPFSSFAGTHRELPSWPEPRSPSHRQRPGAPRHCL